MNIVDKTVIYQILGCALSNEIIISSKKTLKKNSRISLEIRSIDQE